MDTKYITNRIESAITFLKAVEHDNDKLRKNPSTHSNKQAAIKALEDAIAELKNGDNSK